MAQQDVVHDVLFAETDDELIDVAGDRLVEALLTGDDAIAIVTPEHRRRLADRVRAAGLDPEDLQAAGTLTVLDAASTLDRVMPEGSFDGARFDEVTGEMLRGRGDRGPLFVFGEMVALLFELGRSPDALELEAAWDGLLHAASIRMLCAYPGTLLDDPRQAVHVGSVCSMHSAVVTDAALRRRWTLAEDRTAAPTARRLVANALRTRGVPESVFYDTLSVVTELVSNALAQGGVPLSVELVIDDDLVSVRVGDGSPASPHLRPGGPRRSRRRRHVVEELARRWGVDPADGGKVVWAELAR